jgi:hypothetical protein
MKFKREHTDYRRSPYTGMDRQSWLEAAQYLMDGFFRSIASEEEPPLCGRTEYEITYPHRKASALQQERERKAEVFEGLARSFFIAGSLLINEPDASCRGIRLRDYYAEWILRVTDPESPWYVGSYRDMQELERVENPGKPQNPFRTYQQTVETCALVIGLEMTEKEVWERYSRAQQDQIAAFLSDWAHSSTVPQNWRLFNMLDLAFLSRHGYPIDERIMEEHAAAILNYYVGDGWYRDGQSFDFYSCWAFQMYAPLWCSWYGYEHAPKLAEAFEEHSNALMRSYPDFFDRDGWVLLWGRSSIYRNAAVSAFDGNFALRNPSANPGRARRIASGSLLQFLEREDFMTKEGVPSIGFYGPFAPLVQGYSCAESVYWMGKAFLFLALPAEHPFWTAVEQNGDWDAQKGAADAPEGEGSGVSGSGQKALLQKPVKTTVLNGPGLCCTNHFASGETILRTGKVVKGKADRNRQWEYGKLCYNTKYPWESDPAEDSEPEKVSAQEYVLNGPGDQVSYANVCLWAGERSDVLYRRKFFSWDPLEETHWTEAVNLADVALPYGILRCDRLRLLKKPVTVTLGSYGFPDSGIGTEIIRKTERDGWARAIVIRGRDGTGRPRQMAMTVWQGWDDLEIVRRSGCSPECEKSVVIKASCRLEHHYDASEPHVLISQVITKEETEPFSEEELFPLEEIHFADPFRSGACGPIVLCMKSGRKYSIDFGQIEAGLTV